jgi:hypothetical protein
MAIGKLASYSSEKSSKDKFLFSIKTAQSFPIYYENKGSFINACFMTIVQFTCLPLKKFINNPGCFPVKCVLK